MSLGKRNIQRKESVASEDAQQELNVFKQVSKMRVILKNQEKMDLQEKFNNLKQVLDMNLAFSPEEIVEMARVENMRKGAVFLESLKLVDVANIRYFLVKTNTGKVYLTTDSIGFQAVNLNEVIFSAKDLLEASEVFPVKEENLISLPILKTKNFITCFDIFTQRNNTSRLCVLLLTSQGSMYLLRERQSSKIYSSSKQRSPNFDVIVKSDEFTLCNGLARIGEKEEKWAVVQRGKKVLVFSLIENHETDPAFRIEEINFGDEMEDIAGVRGDGNGSLYAWQHGRLMKVENDERRCKGENLFLVYETHKKIVEVQFLDENLLVFLTTNEVIVLIPQVGADKPMKELRTVKMPGVKLTGVCFSTNECLMIVMARLNMYEEPSGISLFKISNGDLETRGQSGISGLSPVEMEGILVSYFSAFLKKRGDFTDLFSLMMMTGSLEFMSNLLETAVLQEKRKEKDISSQQGFIESVQQGLKLSNYQETKIFISRFLLNIYNRTPTNPETISKLKVKLVKAILKQMNADSALLNTLKMDKPKFECPSCAQKTLKIHLDNFVSQCELCLQKRTFFIIDGNLKFLEVRTVLCALCGIYHPDNFDSCILCWSRIGPASMILRR